MADIPNWILWLLGMGIALAGWLINLESRLRSNVLDTLQLRKEIGAIDGRMSKMATELHTQSNAQIRIEERLENLIENQKEAKRTQEEILTIVRRLKGGNA